MSYYRSDGTGPCAGFSILGCMKYHLQEMIDREWVTIKTLEDRQQAALELEFIIDFDTDANNEPPTMPRYRVVPLP